MTSEELKKEVLFSEAKARKVNQMMHEEMNRRAGKAMRALDLDERMRWLEWRRQGLDQVPIGA